MRSVLKLFVLSVLCIHISSWRTKKAALKSVLKSDQNQGMVSDTSARGVPDTIGYVKSVIQNKAKFINQPLATLLDNLEIHVQSYFMYEGEKRKIVGLALFFDDLNTRGRKLDETDPLKKPGTLYTTFKNSVPNEKYFEIHAKSRGTWQVLEQEFYAKQIVVDIN